MAKNATPGNPAGNRTRDPANLKIEFVRQLGHEFYIYNGGNAIMIQGYILMNTTTAMTMIQDDRAGD